MRTWTLAFLCGVLLLQVFVKLPSLLWLIIVIVAIVGFLLFKKARFHARLFIACACGFAWCLWFAHAQTAWTLTSDLEGKTIPITGYIASIPSVSMTGTSFLFFVTKVQSEKVSGVVHLSWRESQTVLRVGDQWQFYVRLKKPYGTMNPGGFDYEAWVLQEGIRANGYVVAKLTNQLLSQHWYIHPVDRVRQYFKEKIEANLPVSNTSPWISALTVGERNDIDAKNWQVLRNTGTNHLMAIAGLHIGFMAILAHFVVSNLWRCLPRLTLMVPAPNAGAVAALLMALTYSAMAGFSIPTQRACLMLFVFLLITLRRRHAGAWHAWCCALLCVLLNNPLCVLTESFWLSFGSVALIIYGVSGRLMPTGLWWKWGRIQWVIAVGLVPLSVALFHQCSLVSFVANSIAIPWVEFVIVPLSLLGCFFLLVSAKAGGFILWLADKILSVLWSVLAWLAHLPGVVWYQTVPSMWVLVAAILGVVFLLFPIGFPGRYFGLVGLLPLILFKPAVPRAGDAWLTVLDVGQGLSAVVQTQNHVLVFDAGPRLSASYDMGDSIVVPFLHFIGAHNVDMLVVSHRDNDHIGGAQAILTQLPVRAVKTSVPELLPNARYCLRGDAWQWDGVDFEFLHPSLDTLGLDNDSSCVLRITIGKQHILLTGDVEKKAEKDLVATVAADLPADILVAPHHGSKTSGLASFVEAVNPHYVVFAVGYRNRYHFPHQSVVLQYQAMGVEALETAKTGAVQFQLGVDNFLNLYRVEHRHYWNN